MPTQSSFVRIDNTLCTAMAVAAIALSTAFFGVAGAVPAQAATAIEYGLVIPTPPPQPIPPPVRR